MNVKIGTKVAATDEFSWDGYSVAPGAVGRVVAVHPQEPGTLLVDFGFPLTTTMVIGEDCEFLA